jgi:hypothetical protein
MFGVAMTWHVWEVGNEPVADGKLEKLWIAVEEIATGKLTLATSPAELVRIAHPSRKADLLDRLSKLMNQLVADERATAEVVLRGHRDTMDRILMKRPPR